MSDTEEVIVERLCVSYSIRVDSSCLKKNLSIKTFIFFPEKGTQGRKVLLSNRYKKNITRFFVVANAALAVALVLAPLVAVVYLLSVDEAPLVVPIG